MADKGDTTTNAMLRIEVTGHAVRIEDLLRERYSVGRGDPGAEAHVDFKIVGDDFLSRQHFSVVRDDKGYVLENHSPNGTQVNGKIIDDTCRLSHKDKIVAGKETTIHYLVLSTSERALQYKAIAEGGADAEDEADDEKRSLFQKPIFWIVVGFYGVLGLIIMGALSQTDTKVSDPGSGPYFNHLKASPLEPARMPEGAREAALDMWERATRDHAGQFAGRGGHDYRLALRARDVLGVLGYATVQDALASEEEVAQVLITLIGNLETKVSELYTEASTQLKAGRGSLARDGFSKIEDAVPDRNLPIRKYARYWANKLRDDK